MVKWVVAAMMVLGFAGFAQAAPCNDEELDGVIERLHYWHEHLIEEDAGNYAGKTSYEVYDLLAGANAILLSGWRDDPDLCQEEANALLYGMWFIQQMLIRYIHETDAGLSVSQNYLLARKLDDDLDAVTGFFREVVAPGLGWEND